MTTLVLGISNTYFYDRIPVGHVFYEYCLCSLGLIIIKSSIRTVICMYDDAFLDDTTLKYLNSLPTALNIQSVTEPVVQA